MHVRCINEKERRRLFAFRATAVLSLQFGAMKQISPPPNGSKERWERSVRGNVLLLAKRDQFSINVI